MSEANGRVMAVVMAAGRGTRMKGATPKVLHQLAGKPLLGWVLDAAFDAGCSEATVVVGHGRDAVRAYLTVRYGAKVSTVVQEPQSGTGHAVMMAMDSIRERAASAVLVLSGDTPRLQSSDLARLLAAHQEHIPLVSMLVSTLDDAAGYGRILRRDGRIVEIKEHRDCSAEERMIREWNPAMYVFDAAFLLAELPLLGSNNAQGEVYLTDLIAKAAGRVTDISVDPQFVAGVNDRAQLAELEALTQHEIARKHQLAGVTLRDPKSTEIQANVTLAEDVVIERGVSLRGHTTVGTGAVIDVGCVLTNVVVDDYAHLKPYTVATDAHIGLRAQVGPFSHLRPASELGEDTHVGNFVELKKTRLGKGSKANHLAYLGDGQVGEGVNIGAGTIFCNYDGFGKHTTTLEDGCFIGSDSQLVAPVTIGQGAYVATGTTVTRNVPAGALAIGRTAQVNKDGYADRLRGRLKAQSKKA